MPSGLATYQRFKAIMALDHLSITRFAAALGTSPQTLKAAVVAFAGTDKIPRSAMSRSILAAVEDKIQTSAWQLTNEDEVSGAETHCPFCQGSC